MPFSRMTHAQIVGPDKFGFRFDFDIAFQAIFDTQTQTVWGYEALVRGPKGQNAAEVLATIPEQAIEEADQHCRETAISLAAKLGLDGYLSLNFLPRSLLSETDYIAATLDFAEEHGFPTDRVIFEFSEAEKIHDISGSRCKVNRHNNRKFLTAMDDFGAGFQGLSLLCEVRPDVIKLDMSLIRNVDQDPRRATIVNAIAHLCQKLDILAICEGIETKAELSCLMQMGLSHFQGFVLARPQLTQLLSQHQLAAAFSVFDDHLRSAG